MPQTMQISEDGFGEVELAGVKGTFDIAEVYERLYQDSRRFNLDKPDSDPRDWYGVLRQIVSDIIPEAADVKRVSVSSLLDFETAVMAAAQAMQKKRRVLLKAVSSDSTGPTPNSSGSYDDA